MESRTIAQIVFWSVADVVDIFKQKLRAALRNLLKLKLHLRKKTTDQLWQLLHGSRTTAASTAALGLGSHLHVKVT